MQVVVKVYMPKNVSWRKPIVDKTPPHKRRVQVSRGILKRRSSHKFKNKMSEKRQYEKVRKIKRIKEVRNISQTECTKKEISPKVYTI